MHVDVGVPFPTGEEGETIQVSVDADTQSKTKVQIDHVGGSTVQQWIFLSPEAAEKLAARLLEAAKK